MTVVYDCSSVKKHTDNTTVGPVMVYEMLHGDLGQHWPMYWRHHAIISAVRWNLLEANFQFPSIFSVVLLYVSRDPIVNIDVISVP